MIGTNISHYRILKKIGEGDTGVVYEATNLDDGDTVAIKFIREELAGESSVRSGLQQTTAAVSELGDPGINTVIDVGTTKDGRTFIVSRYSSGRSLRERMQERPLTMQESINMVVQIAGALASAHGKELLHLDVKPSNILLDDEDRVRLTDFGVAALNAEPSPESTAYMSPERLGGRVVDQRADVFSLGATFFEMLAGCRPFEGENRAEVMTAIMDGEMPHLSQFGTFPESVQAVVSKALARDPVRRYPTMAHLLSELEQLKSQPGGAALAGAKRRSRWIRNGFFGTMVVLVAFVGYYAVKMIGGGGSRVARAPLGKDFVVAVMPFWGDTSESLHVGRTVQTTVANELVDIIGGQPDVAVVGDDEERVPRSHAEARAIGQELSAAVIIWGEVRSQDNGPDITASVTKLLAPTDTNPIWGNLAGPSDVTIQHTSMQTVQSIALLAAGDYHELHGQMKEALSYYERARAVYPDNPWPEHSMGFEFALHGRITEALAAYREAAKIDPSSPLAHMEMAAMLARQGRYDDAIAEYRVAADLDTHAAEPYVEIGAIYYMKGDFDDAATAFDSAADKQSAPIEYGLYEFVALYRTGRTNDARRELAELTRDVKAGSWDAMLVRFYAGDVNDEQLLSATKLADKRDEGTMQCEAFYHAGIARLLNVSGDPQSSPADTVQARDYFQKCVSTQMSGNYEYRFANMELGRLTRR